MSEQQAPEETRAEPVETPVTTLRQAQGASQRDAEPVEAPEETRAELVEARRRGGTLWFTGLPSAGKSTIANALAERLRAEGHAVQVLDGDEVRPHLSAGLGYSRKDRDINVRRIGWVARLLASHGVIVLVPVIAPYAAARTAVRHDHELARVPFAEVYVSTALAVAEARDVKGLYARARRGEVTSMTGVDDPYEQPRSAELVLDTAGIQLADSVDQSYALLTSILDGHRP